MQPYIILLDENKLSGVGSDMAQSCNYKRSFYIQQQSERMLQASRRGVYAYYISDYTQNMCEMSKAEFSAHIQKVGRLVNIMPLTNRF